MKLGSLFDGSGGFPLAGTMCGITPAWASEIEPYPIAVTKARFPNMKHLGDITKIDGAKIEPVDVVTFGSPCQDLSVAGKQKGLAGERSGLFLEAIRIIKEMRTATNGKYPTFIIWENVPGAYSSNKGEDFRTVLQEVASMLYLDLQTVGLAQEPLWVEDFQSLGERWTRNIGEYPNVVKESSLSQILEADVPEKYFLSATACEGVLRRAKRRGKKLPKILENALRKQVLTFSKSPARKTDQA